MRKTREKRKHEKKENGEHPKKREEGEPFPQTTRRRGGEKGGKGGLELVNVLCISKEKDRWREKDQGETVPFKEGRKRSVFHLFPQHEEGEENKIRKTKRHPMGKRKQPGGGGRGNRILLPT